MRYLGIDPGLSGGIAVICEGKAQAWAMPSTERDILDLFREQVALGPCQAFVEQVGPMPKQGVVSVWTFSGNYHGLRMALHACAIPFQAVRPQKWQQLMSCRTRGDKNISKRRAQELFPSIRITHKIADALLLALLCSRTRW